MKKKFVCPICGYVHEGTEAPERCPQCKQLVEWKVLDESAGLNFVTEHVIGIAKDTDDEMKKDLNAHFMGEATEVGMYLAMSRQADREGYPEIAEAFRRYAFEEADHCARFAELLGEVVWDTKTNLEKRMVAECGRRHSRHSPRDGEGRGPSRERFRRSLQPLFQEIVLRCNSLNANGGCCVFCSPAVSFWSPISSRPPCIVSGSH